MCAYIMYLRMNKGKNNIRGRRRRLYRSFGSPRAADEDYLTRSFSNYRAVPFVNVNALCASLFNPWLLYTADASAIVSLCYCEEGPRRKVFQKKKRQWTAEMIFIFSRARAPQLRCKIGEENRDFGTRVH